jgi:hypothetical protein
MKSRFTGCLFIGEIDPTRSRHGLLSDLIFNRTSNRGLLGLNRKGVKSLPNTSSS